MVPAVVRNHVWAAPIIPSLHPKISAGFARGTSLPCVGNPFLRVGQMTRPADNLCLPEHCTFDLQIIEFVVKQKEKKSIFLATSKKRYTFSTFISIFSFEFIMMWVPFFSEPSTAHVLL